jgi:hypothetical protein
MRLTLVGAAYCFGRRTLVALALVATLFAACKDFEGVTDTAPLPSGPPVIETPEEASEYLKATEGGESADDPVDLKVGMEFPTDWPDILSIIAEAQYYVALDMSACTMRTDINGVFNPAAPATTDGEDTGTAGKDLIVSLVLPNTAASVSGIFSNFNELTSVSGKGIVTIGDGAFSQRTKLTEANFPMAETLGNGAFQVSGLIEANFPMVTTIYSYTFYKCNSLKTAAFPAAQTIGTSVFDECTVLETVDFPKVTAIGASSFAACPKLTEVSFPLADTIFEYAFKNCTGLETANLPAVTYIGNNAFYGCTALTEVDLSKAASIPMRLFNDTGSKTLTVTLGATAPALGTQIFKEVTDKTVIVKVPADAQGYAASLPATYEGNGNTTESWGNAFRGGGWTTFSSSYVNTNISLTISSIGAPETQEEQEGQAE